MNTGKNAVREGDRIVSRHRARLVSTDPIRFAFVVLLENGEPMAARISKQGRAAASLESALSQFAKRVSNSVPRSAGGILVVCPDTKEEFSLEGLGHSPKVAKQKGNQAPIVQVTGPASKIKDVLEGKVEASRAIASGGIRVRGDLSYLETVLKDAGLLECE